MLSMLASGDYLRIFAVFAKISCGTAVSRTPLTAPVLGDSFFPPSKRDHFPITRGEVSLDFDLEN